MKSLLPIYISIVTVVIVLFIARNQTNWSELSREKKMLLVGLSVGGLLVLMGLLAAYMLTQ